LLGVTIYKTVKVYR